MDFARLLRVLLRRWLILLVGFLLSAGAAFGVYRVMPRTYEASSQIMLLLRPTANNPDIEVSPFLFLPNGLNTLARVITLFPNTPEFRASMIQAGFESTYTVALQPQNPIVTFTVEADEPTATLRTRTELMRRFSADLDRVQTEEGVPKRQWAHVRVLEESSHVSVRSGDAFRNAAGVGVGGAVLTLLVIALVERRSTRRPRRAVGVVAEDEFRSESGEASDEVVSESPDKPAQESPGLPEAGLLTREESAAKSVGSTGHDVAAIDENVDADERFQSEGVEPAEEVDTDVATETR